MNSTLRLLIGLVTIGGAATSGYFLQKQLYRDDINKKLIANGYGILDDKNEEWDSILNNYISTIAKEKNELKFGDFKGEKGKKEELIAECKKAIEKPATDLNNYEKAKHWCTVPRALKSLINVSGYKSLNTDENDDEKDKNKWNIKLDEHAKDNLELKDKKFKEDQNIMATGTAKKEKANRDAIKKKCKKLEIKKHYELDFESYLEQSKLWCAVKESE